MKTIRNLKNFHMEYSAPLTVLGILLLLGSFVLTQEPYLVTAAPVTAIIGFTFTLFGIFGGKMLRLFERAKMYDPKPIKQIYIGELAQIYSGIVFDVRGVTVGFDTSVEFLLEHGHPDYSGYERIKLFLIDTELVKKQDFKRIKGLMVTNENNRCCTTFYKFSELEMKEIEKKEMGA